MTGKRLLTHLKQVFFRTQMDFKKQEESEVESEEKKLEKIKDDYKNFIEFIEHESKGINYDLFQDYFDFLVPSALAKKLQKTKNKNKNKKLVNLIKNRGSNLKDEIEKMSEDQKEIEQADKILKTVEKILDFNKKIRKQQGLGLKILTPNQMLTRLPICLTQLKAGSNSEKLKNEIKQLFYFLYRSKNLQSNSVKVWLALFKDGNNLYEH